MKPVTGQEEIEEGQTEHALARSALAEMLNLAPDEPGFEAALETTKAAIEHHVQDEEGEVFPRLRQDGERVLADTATPFMRRRLELGLPVRPDASHPPQTRTSSSTRPGWPESRARRR